MRTIKIFLASSAELDSDKEQVELFVSRKNKDYNKKRLFLELSTWKDFISAMTEEHTQEKYNQYIRSCDIAIFLFHTKLGRFTKEEFETAHQAFLQSSGKTKKPLIYTFFKNDYNESAEILDLKNHIDGLEHFFDTYNSIDDLFVKINRQLDKLENKRVIKPDPIDVKLIVKYAVYYFLLPLLVLSGAISTFYYYQPTNLTVKISEPNPIPGLSLEEGQLTLTYGDKTETLPIKTEAIFKQVPSKYKRENLRLQFSSNGYIPIDTLISTNELINLPVRRDNSLGAIFGIVKDEDNVPVKDVTITVLDLKTTSDKNGSFKFIIPRGKQAKEQRLKAYKEGYKLWDRTFPVFPNLESPVILKK